MRSLAVVVMLCTLHTIATLNYTLLRDVLFGKSQLVWDAKIHTRNVLSHELLTEYDFVVVGAGSGGSTVTNRLTEVPEWTVLLLEAGGEENFVTSVPSLHNHMMLTDLAWQYVAQPQDSACLGLDNRQCRFPQGKGVGGTSMINAMIYTRGHRRDYDAWAELGNPGWSWNDVLPYFKKSERARGEFADSQYHGINGNLGVENVKHRFKIGQSFINGAQEIGLQNVDYNSGDEIGYSFIQATILNGTRCSANKAFLKPIINRKNFHVAKNARVTKIIIDNYTKKAIGIEFFREGRYQQVRARKEVIVSAGAINTPQLLMLSGIGPKEHLEFFGITVLHDAPGVGQNLQDHVTFTGLAFLLNDTVSLVVERSLKDPKELLNYFAYKTGPFASLGGPEAIAFVRTSAAKTPLDYPDIELLFIAGSYVTDEGTVFRKGIGVRDDIYNTVYKPIEGRDTWSIFPMITRQQSKGWVRLKSKNPFKWPIMFGNYFAEKDDLTTLVEGIKYAIKLSKTNAFQRYNSTLHDIPLPACKQLQFGSDEYWACAGRQLTTTLHHFCGTAKMGPANDTMAVVDPELRVYGIQNLRVVDASIIPLIPAAHTNAAAYMIGEKAADMIKQAYAK